MPTRFPPLMDEGRELVYRWGMARTNIDLDAEACDGGHETVSVENEVRRRESFRWGWGSRNRARESRRVIIIDTLARIEFLRDSGSSLAIDFLEGSKVSPLGHRSA